RSILDICGARHCAGSPAANEPRRSRAGNQAASSRRVEAARALSPSVGLRRRRMLVKHILRDKGREVVTITSDATLSEAALLLARKRIGAVVVRDRDGSVAGILSERDLVRAVAESSVNALAQAVSSHMTRNVIT